MGERAASATPRPAGRLACALRCAAAAASASALAQALGLEHPVWAAVSSLIVSQEKLEATRHSVVGRILGTMFGAVVAVLVGEMARHAAVPVEAQIAPAVALRALAVKGRPQLRVGLWTCPVVWRTTAPGMSVAHTGPMRACAVIMGAVAAGLTHRIGHEVAKLRPAPWPAGRR